MPMDARLLLGSLGFSWNSVIRLMRASLWVAASASTQVDTASPTGCPFTNRSKSR